MEKLIFPRCYPSYRGDVMTPQSCSYPSPPLVIVSDVNDRAVQWSTWAFLLLWYITSWPRAGEVMSFWVSILPLLPPTQPPPLVWLELLQNQWVVLRCFRGIVWEEAEQPGSQQKLKKNHTDLKEHHFHIIYCFMWTTYSNAKFRRCIFTFILQNLDRI